ncbi:MAG: DUF262 domain-containing protein, partial [Crenarchaeota archaeon]|nr:DUF262 domain-containing protein [Thermoproteota archaeon]
MDKRARSSIYHTSSGRLLYESSRYLEPSTDVEMIVEVINFDVKTIYDRLISGEIYIDPDIQRGYVWDPVKATYFFDSIVRGFPIPPIVLLVSSGKYIVLDGVQRILTIKKIINNEITLVALPEYHGKKFSQLNQEVRDKFLHRMLICFRVHVKAPNDIERVKAVCSIIRRLNIGQVRMTLTQILFITAPHSDAIRVLNSIARNDIFRNLAQPTETEIATLHDRNILLMLATCIRNNKILNLGSAGKTKNFRYIVKTLFD